MKTTQNVAKVSAVMIRRAAKTLRRQLHTNDGENALASLDAIADELDQFAPAFEPDSEVNDIEWTEQDRKYLANLAECTEPQWIGEVAYRAQRYIAAVEAAHCRASVAETTSTDARSAPSKRQGKR